MSKMSFFKKLAMLLTITLALSSISVIAAEPNADIGESTTTVTATNTSAINTDQPQEYIQIPFIESLGGDVQTTANGTLHSSRQWQLLKLTNKQRAANGLWPLSMSDNFQSVADTRSKELASLFSHTRPDGRDCFSIFSDCNITITAGGENIAWGAQSPSSVITGWMNSTGHRANILSQQYTHLGAG